MNRVIFKKTKLLKDLQEGGLVPANYPSYGTKMSMGLDMRAVTNGLHITIPAGETVMVGTGLHAQGMYEKASWDDADATNIIASGVAPVLLPRSGKGAKGLVLGNLVGLIDPDYKDEVKMCLYNRTDKPITVECGERVAQLCFIPMVQVDPVIVDALDEVDSDRDGGFGHTGTK
jgi:dUTP pyrophosphatase